MSLSAKLLKLFLEMYDCCVQHHNVCSQIVFQMFYITWSYVRHVTQNRISDVLYHFIMWSICYAESYFRCFYIAWSYVRYVTQNHISDVLYRFNICSICYAESYFMFLYRFNICSICYAESYFRCFMSPDHMFDMLRRMIFQMFYIASSYVRYVTQNRISYVFI
jgi:hypothetical protein